MRDKTQTRAKGEICGWAFVVVGVICLLGSVSMLAIKSYCIATYHRTEGTVVDNREERRQSKAGETVHYFPLIEFADPAGIRQRIEADYDLDQPLAQGTMLPVHYPVGDSSRAFVGGDGYWLTPLGILLVGGLILAWGTTLLLVTRWFERRWPTLLQRL